MKIGVVLPQTEFGPDRGALVEFVQAAEGLGYDYLLTYEHILGADPEAHPGPFIFTHRDPFHEPFVMFAYLAGLTRTIEFVTGVLVLPQRDVCLVAKQAAELQNLSQGRLRLGVGVGWNRAEFEALGQSFENRGRRIEEQLRLLKQLWSQPLVDFLGEFHNLRRVGINPLPEIPIPLWMGGWADPVLNRAARHADGWIPSTFPEERAEEIVGRLRGYLQEFGRQDFGLDVRVKLAGHPREMWKAHLERWRGLGATHLRLNSLGAGLTTVKDHLRALEDFQRFVRELD